jgi:hypothetical protein
MKPKTAKQRITYYRYIQKEISQPHRACGGYAAAGYPELALVTNGGPFEYCTDKGRTLNPPAFLAERDVDSCLIALDLCIEMCN